MYMLNLQKNFGRAHCVKSKSNKSMNQAGLLESLKER